MHKNNVIYRGINSNYIFIDKGENAVLCNFCLVTDSLTHADASHTAHTCIAGNTQYNSPEMNKEGEYKYTSDIWALGVLISEMCTNEFPFLNHMYHRRARISEDILETINDDVLKDIMVNCLKLKPEERIPLWSIIDQL